MWLLDLFKKKKGANNNAYKYAPSMSGVSPFFSSFGESLYASDLIVQSIRCKSNEMKKLDPRHIRTTNGIQTVVSDSDVARLLKRPNEYMTTADFLEKITILLELNKNAYIYPAYYKSIDGTKRYIALYPLKPSSVDYLVDESGKYFLKLRFASGYETTLPREDIIHWRKDYGVNDYFGGGAYGGNDDAGLMKTIAEYDRLCQSIAKAIACSCQVNGIVRYNSYMSDDKLDAERATFNQRLVNNEGGVLFTDLKTEYTPIERDVKLVDAETLKFFHETILRANGTSLAILNGDYTKSQKEAYYEHALEADIKSLGQAMSMTFFSERESAFGNEIVLYPNDIAFMSMENKISALQTGLPAGIFTRNEARALLGYPPIEGGDDMPRGYNNVDNSTGNNDNSIDENEEGNADEEQ